MSGLMTGAVAEIEGRQATAKELVVSGPPVLIEELSGGLGLGAIF